MTQSDHTEQQQIELVTRINNKRRSGMTVAKACKEVGVIYSLYYDWARKHRLDHLFVKRARGGCINHKITKEEQKQPSPSFEIRSLEKFLSSAPKGSYFFVYKA